VLAHYDAFLAGSYTWLSGQWEEQVQITQKFFSSHAVTSRDNRIAIDLGAGCGFQSVPPAQPGFSVTVVDFCQPLLDELLLHTGALPIVTVRSDIRYYSSWSGRHPALMFCMGDTLTLLATLADMQDLIRQCLLELDPDGRLVLTLREYCREPDGAVVVIPVLRGKDRIFICKLKYHADNLIVQDILYSRGREVWMRSTGKYTKIRITPDTLTGMLTGAGFGIEFAAVNEGMITVIARKVA
jgi:hypothetical protein